ncbi:MAG: DJ-1 family glyoxalase III [Candidatus Omnitrophota bacterium]|jgi:4-methyl-5(b-hydroxyethyl)-thiazole monophosphate biosynthesis
MAKTALVILADGFEDIEATTPMDLLTRAGIQVTVAGLTSTHVKAAKSGLTIIVPTTLSAVHDNFDALILPGGMPGAENLANSSDLIARVRLMNQQKKIIAAICAAPALILTKAGILENKKATCFPGMENLFPESATHISSAVVRDDNIITSRGAGTAFSFSLTIIEALLGKGPREKIARTTGFEGNYI